jgi:hypothetical protein
MIAAIGAGFGLGKPGLVWYPWHWGGHICRVGDKVQDKVPARRDMLAKTHSIGTPMI